MNFTAQKRFNLIKSNNINKKSFVGIVKKIKFFTKLYY